MERVAGIEPAQPAWKAGVLPLNYTRLLETATFMAFLDGGGGWIRTTEAYASDLQSDPFDHSGTPPRRAPKELFPLALFFKRGIVGELGGMCNRLT